MKVRTSVFLLVSRFSDTYPFNVSFKYSLNITVSQNRIKNNISPLRYNIYFRRFTCFQEEKIKSSASIRLYRTIYSHPENNLQKTTYKKCPPDRKSCIATTQQLFKSNITIRFFFLAS